MTKSVGVVYDVYTEDVQAQIVRDLLILLGQWEVAVYDPANQIDQSFLDQLYVEKTSQKPDMYLAYKTGEKWPKTPLGVEVVKRDLNPEDVGIELDLEPKTGHYIREQGRDGASLTERYLGRSHPKGNGVTDPLVVMLWS